MAKTSTHVDTRSCVPSWRQAWQTLPPNFSGHGETEARLGLPAISCAASAIRAPLVTVSVLPAFLSCLSPQMTPIQIMYEYHLCYMHIGGSLTYIIHAIRLPRQPDSANFMERNLEGKTGTLEHFREGACRRLCQNNSLPNLNPTYAKQDTSLSNQ